MSSAMFPSQQTATSPEAEAVEHVEVNMDYEVEASNPNADFNEILPPTKAGPYLFRWEVDPDKPIQPSQTIPKQAGQASTPFLNVWLIGRAVTDNPEESFVANYYMNTLINRKKGTSEVHHFLNIVGSPTPIRIKLSELKAKLEEVLAANPISPAKYEWRCSYKTGQVDKKGNPIWTEQFSRMDQFPKELDEHNRPTGNYLNVVKSNLDGSPIYAQGYIPKYGLLTDADYKKLTS